MRIALEEARLAGEAGDVPVGAVLVDANGHILAQGRNTREVAQTALGHAEINTISAGCATLGAWRLEGCTLYVTLEPCAMCAGAIINARIPKVVYGAPDLRFGAFGSLINLAEVPLNHKPEVVGGVLKDENVAMLQNYFKGKRAKK